MTAAMMIPRGKRETNEAIEALGAKWDSHSKNWLVPDDKTDAVQSIYDAASPRHWSMDNELLRRADAAQNAAEALYFRTHAPMGPAVGAPPPQGSRWYAAKYDAMKAAGKKAYDEVIRAAGWEV